MSRYVSLCYVLSLYVMLRYVTLRYVLLCYVHNIITSPPFVWLAAKFFFLSRDRRGGLGGAIFFNPGTSTKKNREKYN